MGMWGVRGGKCVQDLAMKYEGKRLFLKPKIDERIILRSIVKK